MKEYFICTEQDLKDAPNEIKIVPLGKVTTTKGDFIVDEISFDEITEWFLKRKIDIVIDYEHQTLLNIEAPAAGWIKSLKLGDDSIIASVEWTEKAKQYLVKREYRYLSPVVLVRKSDGRAIQIQSVALTNTPAIDGMFAVCKDLGNKEEKENKMDLKELAKMLELPEDSSESVIMEAIKKALQPKQQDTPQDGGKKDDKQDNPSQASDSKEELVANSTILGLLNLDGKATTAEVAAKILSLSTGSSNVEAELMQLKQNMAEREAKEVVAKALDAGKITPAQEEWARTYALNDKKGFEAFVEKAPVVVPYGRMNLKDAPEAKTIEYDQAILKNCGVSEEDVKKYYKAGGKNE